MIFKIFGSFFIIKLLFVLYQLYKFKTKYVGIIFPYSLVKEKILVKDNHRIVLLGMIHIAPKEFYDGIIERHGNGKLLTLMEGVKKKGKKSGKTSGYDGIAKKLGMKAQSVTMFKNTINADVKWEELRPNTRIVMDRVFKLIHQIGQDDKPLDLKELSKALGAGRISQRIKRDILVFRNQRLLEYIYKHRDEDLLVPWGAAHLPGIEKELLNDGYVVEKTKWIKHANLLTTIVNHITFIRKLIRRFRVKKG